MVNIIFSIILLLLFFSNLFMYNKYNKLKAEINSYNNIGTGRYGFYNNIITTYSDYNAIIYVIELDRYLDGYSKIKIDKIEPFNKRYSSKAIELANENFLTLKTTSKIEWLESEDYIKKLRKEKLDVLNKFK